MSARMFGDDDDPTRTKCAACGEDIDPDDGGAIWYHVANMSAFCDGDDDPDLSRQASPVTPVRRFYASADAPGPDATWTVYREVYATPDAAEPIDGLTVRLGTYPTEAAADAAANQEV